VSADGPLKGLCFFWVLALAPDTLSHFGVHPREESRVLKREVNTALEIDAFRAPPKVKPADVKLGIKAGVGFVKPG
jgi:hypothetical protein